MSIKAPRVGFSHFGDYKPKEHTYLGTNMLDVNVLKLDKLVIKFKTNRASFIRALILKELDAHPNKKTLKEYIDTTHGNIE